MLLQPPGRVTTRSQLHPPPLHAPESHKRRLRGTKEQRLGSGTPPPPPLNESTAKSAGGVTFGGSWGGRRVIHPSDAFNYGSSQPFISQPQPG